MLCRRKMDNRADDGRLVTCAGRRRSSAMESYQLVRTASITKRNVFSHMSRRRETLQKGENDR